MSYNVNIPAAVPRTLIRTPQLNPVLAAMRAAQDGLYLRGAGPGVVEWAPAEMSGGGAITGTTTVNCTTPMPPATGAGWLIASEGSDANVTATHEGARNTVMWLLDNRQGAKTGAALVVDVIEDVAGAIGEVARTGIHSKIFTRPDRGESSAGLFVQSGGGGTLTAYKTHRLRPAGKPNLSYSYQGVLEAATDDMGQAALFQSGVYFPTAAGNPDPTLSSAIDAAPAATLALSSTAGFPVPGGPTPYPVSAPATWPTPLYAQIWPAGGVNAYGGEVVSYTGVSGNTLTGVVRGYNSTRTARPAGTKVSFVCAGEAILVRMASPISKGLTVIPADGLSFDARPAITIGVNNHGQPAELSARLVIRLNGDIESAGNLTAGDVTALGNLNVAGQTGSLTSSAGTYTALNLGATGNLNVGGTAQAGTVTARRLVGSGAPSAAPGTGAGSGAGLSASVSGSDLAGALTVSTGATAPAANAVVATVTFSSSLGAAPKAVLLTPANINARALSATGQVWVDLPDISATAFAVRANVALAASTAYQWYYHVIG